MQDSRPAERRCTSGGRLSLYHTSLLPYDYVVMPRSLLHTPPMSLGTPGPGATRFPSTNPHSCMPPIGLGPRRQQAMEAKQLWPARGTTPVMLEQRMLMCPSLGPIGSSLFASDVSGLLLTGSLGRPVSSQYRSRLCGNSVLLGASSLCQRQDQNKRPLGIFYSKTRLTQACWTAGQDEGQ